MTSISTKMMRIQSLRNGRRYDPSLYDQGMAVDFYIQVTRLHQDLKSYFYHLLSEDPYGVLQPENGDPDDGQVIYHKDWRTKQGMSGLSRLGRIFTE